MNVTTFETDGWTDDLGGETLSKHVMTDEIDGFSAVEFTNELCTETFPDDIITEDVDQGLKKYLAS